MDYVGGRHNMPSRLKLTYKSDRKDSADVEITLYKSAKLADAWLKSQLDEGPYPGESDESWKKRQAYLSKRRRTAPFIGGIDGRVNSGFTVRCEPNAVVSVGLHTTGSIDDARRIHAELKQAFSRMVITPETPEGPPPFKPCPFVRLPSIAGNKNALAAQMRQQGAIAELQKTWKDLETDETELYPQETRARAIGEYLGNTAQIRLAPLQLRCVESLRAIEGVSQELRDAERDWLQSLAGIGGGMPRSIRRELIALARQRAECLREKMYQYLEELKKVDRVLIMELRPEVGRRYQQYATARDDLGATLDLMGVLINLDVEAAELEKRRARREGKELAEAQQALYQSFVDRAEWALLAIETKTITSLESQKHYYNAVTAIRGKGETTPWMDAIHQDAAQCIAQDAHYVLASIGSAWTGFVDVLKHLVREEALDTLTVQTLAQQVDGMILEARKASDVKLGFVREMREFSPQAAQASRATLSQPATASLVSAGHGPLMADRGFHELTDGGLFRIYGAFDTTRTDHLETEYLAALHHARLGVRDMQTSLNLDLGRVPATGEFTFKIFLDPMRIAQVVIADTPRAPGEQGALAEKRLFIESKRSEVEQEMAQLAPRWRKAGFEFDLIADFLPLNFQHHMDLTWSNEDYCMFVIRSRLFDHQERLDELDTALQTARDHTTRRQIESYRELNRLSLSLELRPHFARVHQLRAQRQIICRDWVGAALSVEEAIKSDPRLEPVLRNVRNNLLWEDVLQSGIDIFRQVGNKAVLGAVSAKIMQFIGPAAAAGGQTPSFNEFVWGQINPFHEVLSSQEAGKVLELITNGAEEIAQQSLGQTLTQEIGIEREYAEFAAGLIVSAASKWGQELSAETIKRLGNNPLADTAADLQTVAATNAKRRPDVDPDIELGREKEDLTDRLVDLSKVAEVAEIDRQTQADYVVTAAKSGAESADAGQAREKLIDARSDLDGITRPVTESRIRKCLAQYEAAAGDDFELKHAIRLFRRLPLKQLRDLKRQKQLPAAMEQRLDDLRLKMVDALQMQISKEFQGDVLCLVVTGAAADPAGPEYIRKLLDSDIDFTFLVRTGVDEPRLQQIERRFRELVASASGRVPAKLADSTAFCDKLGRQQGLEEVISTTRVNIANPERYLNLGTGEFVQFMNKVAGRLKGFDAENGRWTVLPVEMNASVFRDMRFEDWMGVDIALEQFRFRETHRKPGENVEQFLKQEGKYTIRAALGKLLTIPEARARLNQWEYADVVRAGGVHAAIVALAADYEGRIFTPAEISLLKRCNELKIGAAPEKVFGVSDGAALNRAFLGHQQEVDKFFAETLRVTLTTQQSAFVELEKQALASAKPEDQDKLYMIHFVQAYAVSRLNETQRAYLQKLSLEGGKYTALAGTFELAKAFADYKIPSDTEGGHYQGVRVPRRE